MPWHWCSQIAVDELENSQGSTRGPLRRVQNSVYLHTNLNNQLYSVYDWFKTTVRIEKWYSTRQPEKQAEFHADKHHFPGKEDFQD